MRKIRNVGIGALALGLLVGAAVTIKWALDARKKNAYARQELPAATRDERMPTHAEFKLIQLLGEAGWDISELELKFGTDPLGEYLLMPTSYGLAELRFVPGDPGSFQVDSCDGDSLTSSKTVNMTYQDFCSFMAQE